MSRLSLKIVTPEKLVLEKEDLDSVSIPTSEGEITVLPNHVPLVTNVAAGELILRTKDKQDSIVITSGFMKLNEKGAISIMTDYAVRSDELEIAKIEEAKKKAEEMLKEKKSEKEFAIAEAELRKTLLELKVAKKRKIKH